MASRKAAKARARAAPRAARRGAGKPARKTAARAVRRRVEPVPARYGSLVPGLAIRGCAEAIVFYAKAFGARQLSRMDGPDGKVMHAELRIGDRVLFVGDEAPEMGAPSPQGLGGSPVSLLHYVKDVDAVFARAVEAGAKPVMPPADMFWGDRYGMVVDPFGHRWGLATHKADLTDAQTRKAMEAWMASQGAPPA